MPNTGTAAAPNNRNKEVVFKIFWTIHWLYKINIMQIDNAKDIDLVMNMYNLTEYSEDYL